MIESGSSIKLNNCRIFQNFAITAGLIEVNSDGYFEMYNSTIFQNYGMTNTFAEIVSSSSFSIINNCIIYNNVILHTYEIINEFSKTWRLLCFVSLTLRAYIISNPVLFNYPDGSKLFDLIDSNVSIQNGTVLFDQISLFKSFLSTIEIKNSTIYNMK